MLPILHLTSLFVLRSPNDVFVRSNILSWIISAAQRISIPGLSRVLLDPLGIPWVITQLNESIDKPKSTKASPEKRRRPSDPERWWKVLSELSELDWGVRILLRCGIAEVVEKFKSVKSVAKLHVSKYADKRML